MASFVGQNIGGRYQITDELGQGGMATVYKAYDARLERDVAIKVIRTDLFGPAVLEPLLKRFELEARSLAKFDHPNIISIYDYGEYQGAPFLVMQYLPGGTLKERIGGRCLPWQEAAQIAAAIARALAYAHQRDIIHRDVKPANVLVAEDGILKLSDFGIAKALESKNTTQLTGTGMGIGTPQYMAPEQWRGKAVLQTDIYALGVVFYELVTGHRPYDADTPGAIFEMVLVHPLPRPKDDVPDLPYAVERIFFKALAKKPEDRYAEMGEFVKALEQLSVTGIQKLDIWGLESDKKLVRPTKGEGQVGTIALQPWSEEGNGAGTGK
jgi:eukaryotic-like serine/threonine-protein kinase